MNDPDYPARLRKMLDDGFKQRDALVLQRDEARASLAEALEQVPKWTQPIDYAPEDCVDVLAVWWQGEQCIAHRRNGIWWYRGNMGMKQANVPPTHFMPLPGRPTP